MTLLHVPSTTTADVIAALRSGATALRKRATQLDNRPESDIPEAQGTIALWREDARMLDALADELSPS